jgi:hypothetical protein
MKKITFLVLGLVIGTGFLHTSFGQTDIYTTSGGEIIFSFASIEQDGNETGSILRFAPVLNLQSFVNFDVAEHAGFFVGLGIRNLGFIYDQDDDIRKKFRTYNLGIPMGIKLGNLEKTFGYVGYEFEIPFHYKEKTFISEKKDKFAVWFSDRVPTLNHSLIVGIQFPYGFNLKFKYYFNEFFNRDFEELDSDTGTRTKPYENLKVHVMYISVAFNLFKNAKIYEFD